MTDKSESREGWYGYATFGYSDQDKENRIKKKLQDALDSLKKYELKGR